MKKNLLIFIVCLMMVLTAMVLFSVTTFANTVMQPYLCGVTTNSVWVLSECNSTATATVDFGTTTSYGSTATTSSTEATNGSTYVHNIKLTGLAANTTYHYRVRQGTSTSADYSFKTAPNAGTSFRFAYTADYRSNTAPHDAVAAKVKAANPAMLLNGGDLAIDGGYSNVKGQYFRANELSILSSTPQFFSPGNHEGWNASTKAWFQGPANNAASDPDYYSFNYGDMHVVMTNSMVARNSGSAQYNFVSSDMSSDTHTWKVQFTHYNAFVWGGSHPTPDGDTKALSTNVLEPNGVDFEYSGHSHFYQHFDKNGMHHLLVGSSGAPLYSLGSGTAPAYFVKQSKSYCYAIMDVTSTSYTAKVYNDAGSLLETITKTAGPTPTPAPTPDLVVTDITWSPASPATGNAVTFSATVKNQGTAATAGGTILGVAFQMDGAGTTMWCDNYSTSLAPGASVTLTVNGGTNGSTWTATSGTHTVLAWVDDVNRIAESNETNNQRTESFTVGGSVTPTPTPTPTPPPPGALFTTGFETGDTQTTWADTVEVSANVTGYPPALVPECSKRTGETYHAGTAALMYSGTDNSTTSSFCYYKSFDVNIPISSTTKLGYWFYPQQENGRRVAVDFVCTDGTTLRDSGATTTTGIGMHPGNPKGTVNTWTNIQCNIGQWLNGKTIDRILVGYDQNANTGGYRGYIDDISITN